VDTPGAPSPDQPKRTWTLHFGNGPEWSSSQLGLTGAHVLAVLVFLFAMQGATGGFDSVWWMLALVPVVTMSWAGSAAPLMLWGLLIAAWFFLSPTGAFSWWSLLGATGVILAHAATALSSTVPPAAHLARHTLVRWARHTTTAGAAAFPVALLVGAVHGRELGLGPVAFVIGLAGLAVGVWLARSNPPVRPD